MRAGRALEPAAAAILAGACAFAAATLRPGGGVGALAVATLIFTFVYCLSLAALLRNAAADARFALAGFDPAPLVGLPDELLLEDLLESAGSDSRVVRLFGAGRAPGAGRPPGDAPARDDTQAMLRALEELRRSFR